MYEFRSKKVCLSVPVFVQVLLWLRLDGVVWKFYNITIFLAYKIVGTVMRTTGNVTFVYRYLGLGMCSK